MVVRRLVHILRLIFFIWSLSCLNILLSVNLYFDKSEKSKHWTLQICCGWNDLFSNLIFNNKLWLYVAVYWLFTPSYSVHPGFDHQNRPSSVPVQKCIYITLKQATTAAFMVYKSIIKVYHPQGTIGTNGGDVSWWAQLPSTEAFLFLKTCGGGKLSSEWGAKYR